MERLTEWNGGQTRHAYYPRCFKEPCYGSGCKIKDCPFETAVCERLAAYEDTGLTPEEIKAPFTEDTLQSVPPSRQKDPGKCNLTQRVAMERMFATPCARDYRTGQRKRYENPARTCNLNDQIGGQLNPTWVEWLMGFPLGWTDLNASETL